jgi:recombinational DNA repair protein (RecF pathway)
MHALLDQLDDRPSERTTVLAFELKLLRELGQSPNPGETRLNPGARRILAQLTDLDWEALPRLRLSTGQQREIEQFLHGFLIYHLGRIPSGRSAALGQNPQPANVVHQPERPKGPTVVPDRGARSRRTDS